jgi:hypothetical protein
LECAFKLGASGIHNYKPGKWEQRSEQVNTFQLVHQPPLHEGDPAQ